MFSISDCTWISHFLTSLECITAFFHSYLAANKKLGSAKQGYVPCFYFPFSTPVVAARRQLSVEQKRKRLQQTQLIKRKLVSCFIFPYRQNLLCVWEFENSRSELKHCKSVRIFLIWYNWLAANANWFSLMECDVMYDEQLWLNSVTTRRIEWNKLFSLCGLHIN